MLGRRRGGSSLIPGKGDAARRGPLPARRRPPGAHSRPGTPWPHVASAGPSPGSPGAAVQSRPPGAAPHAVAGPPLRAPPAAGFPGLGFWVARWPRAGAGLPLLAFPLCGLTPPPGRRFPAFLRAPSKDETPSLPIIPPGWNFCPYRHPGFAPAGSRLPLPRIPRAFHPRAPPPPQPGGCPGSCPFAPGCLPFQTLLPSPHFSPTT